MQEELLKVVLDEELECLLKEIGQWESLENGELFCNKCAIPLSLKTLQIIMPLESGEFEFVCSNIDCVHSYVES